MVSTFNFGSDIPSNQKDIRGQAMSTSLSMRLQGNVTSYVGVLSREQEIALKKFVEVLAAYFPAFSSLIYPIHQINTFPRQHILSDCPLFLLAKSFLYI